MKKAILVSILSFCCVAPLVLADSSIISLPSQGVGIVKLAAPYQAFAIGKGVTVTNQTIISYTVPAGALGKNGTFFIQAAIESNDLSLSGSMDILFGGTVIATGEFGDSLAWQVLKVSLQNNNATNSQSYWSEYTDNTHTVYLSSNALVAIDTSLAQDILIRYSATNADAILGHQVRFFGGRGIVFTSP